MANETGEVFGHHRFAPDARSARLVGNVSRHQQSNRPDRLLAVFNDPYSVYPDLFVAVDSAIGVVLIFLKPKSGRRGVFEAKFVKIKRYETISLYHIGSDYDDSM